MLPHIDAIRILLIYVKSFINLKDKVNYLVGIVFSYLKLLHYSRFCVPTHVQDNPFSAIKHVTKDDSDTTHYLKSVLAIVMPIFVEILQHLR
jgi:hypothetical protein